MNEKKTARIIRAHHCISFCSFTLALHTFTCRTNKTKSYTNKTMAASPSILFAESLTVFVLTTSMCLNKNNSVLFLLFAVKEIICVFSTFFWIHKNKQIDDLFIENSENITIQKISIENMYDFILHTLHKVHRFRYFTKQMLVESVNQYYD
jgi:nitrogen fixation-related uncharacterized protein